MIPRHLLVAPDAFTGALTAARAAAAIGRGLEAAGQPAPDLCPVAAGGAGTLAAVLPVLGGETAGLLVHDPLGREVSAGFGLLEGGGTALIEVDAASGLRHIGEPSPWTALEAGTRGTGELIVAAVQAGAQVVLVAAGDGAATDGGLGALEAIEEAGGLHGARLVVLCDAPTAWEAAPATSGPAKGADPSAICDLQDRLAALAATFPRDPRGVPRTGAAGGLAGGLWAVHGAVLEAGAPFVLDLLDFDARMRAARAVVVGGALLDARSLRGGVAGEAATRARQAGVPCHAVVGRDVLDPLERRILDLQHVLEAAGPGELEAAGEALAAVL